MRFEGQIKSWNEERGFGFIAPDQGGQDIFIHATSFPPGAGRPVAGQRVSFEVALNRDGKKRAKGVMPERAAPVRRRPERARSRVAPTGSAKLLAAPAFLAAVGASVLLGRVPVWTLAVYGAMSVVCFFAYAFDKSAAAAGRWRTPESTLLGLGLLCGWPGGLIAQHLLRHKSSKAPFLRAFWFTVAVNVVAFGWLCFRGVLRSAS